MGSVARRSRVFATPREGRERRRGGTGPVPPGPRQQGYDGPPSEPASPILLDEGPDGGATGAETREGQRTQHAAPEA